MKARLENGTVKKYGSLPTRYLIGNTLINLETASVEIQQNEGFYEVQEAILVEYQSKEPLVDTDLIDNIWVERIRDWSQEEIDTKIQSDIINTSQINKKILIDQELEKTVVDDAQLSDDIESLDNSDLFPFWSFPKDYVLDEKTQAFDGNELFLYRCVQAHESQSTWNPPIVPALFSKVEYPGVIGLWVQPTGAQDAYNIDDKVHYPTLEDPVWISKIDANTTVPDGDEPFNRYWEPFIE